MTDELKIEQRHRDAAVGWGLEPSVYADAHERLARHLAQFEADTLASQARRIEALRKEVRELLTAITFAAPPKLFNGVECYEARVPVEFVKNARVTLEETSRG